MAKKHFLFPLQKRKNNYIRFYSAISDSITDPAVVGVPTDDIRTNVKHKIMPSFPIMELGEVYFHTASILNWEYLLKMDKYKKVVLDSLNHLSKNNKIKVYGFVIMPNHIHLIWELLEKNGKEMPHVSFMKHTAHEFLKDLKTHHPQVLPRFASNQEDRKYQFWQRNSLPVILYSKKILEQKLDYIHYNPTAGKWNLASDYVEYYYSSAKFYEEEIKDFEFLVDYRERF